ncbi:hypothetical protein [Sulfurimonas sp.]
MKSFLLFLLLLSTLLADKEYSIRGAYGFSSASDLDQLYTFQGLNPSPYNTTVYALDGGYLLSHNFNDLPFDFYFKGGVSYFDENGYQSNFFEALLYIKLFYNIRLFENEVRIGFGEGVSYADKIPWVEHMEALRESDNESNLLNYLDVTIDFNLGKAFRIKELEGYYIGYLIKHRSGFHGAYGGVKDGGSNYNSIYLEKYF